MAACIWGLVVITHGGQILRQGQAAEAPDVLWAIQLTGPGLLSLCLQAGVVRGADKPAGGTLVWASP